MIMVTDQCAESFHERCKDKETGMPLLVRDISKKPAGHPEFCHCACHHDKAVAIESGEYFEQEKSIDEELAELNSEPHTELEELPTPQPPNPSPDHPEGNLAGAETKMKLKDNDN